MRLYTLHTNTKIHKMTVTRERGMYILKVMCDFTDFLVGERLKKY